LGQNAYVANILEENMIFRVVILTKTFATFSKPKKKENKKENYINK